MPLTPTTPPRRALDTVVRDRGEECRRAKDRVGAALPLTDADTVPCHHGRERSAAPCMSPTKPQKGTEQRALNAINTDAKMEECCDLNFLDTDARREGTTLPLTPAYVCWRTHKCGKITVRTTLVRQI